MSEEKKTIYVAIIGKAENVGLGNEHPKTFTGTDKDALIRTALRARDAMEQPRSGLTYGPYTIFIGEMTGTVETPTTYEVKPL